MIETLAMAATLYFSIGLVVGVYWTLATYWQGPFEARMIPDAIAGTIAVMVLWPLFVIMAAGIGATILLMKLGGIER